jgi:putative heme iron utilization protein
MAEVELVRTIIQTTTTASLGSLDAGGSPFVSLVTVTATGPRRIVMLLSGLARHTKNLLAHPAASLLLCPRPAADDASHDPLTAARVTLVGMVRRLSRGEDSESRTAFLTAHPQAAMYADFGDFAFYELTIDEAHLVAGFGRIETIGGEQL